MSVLPHLMPHDEIDRFFPVVRLDEGENQWAHTLEGGITRPSEELSDPGPRGNQVASSIKEFGFTSPVLIDESGGIIAGLLTQTQQRRYNSRKLID